DGSGRRPGTRGGSGDSGASSSTIGGSAEVDLFLGRSQSSGPGASAGAGAADARGSCKARGGSGGRGMLFSTGFGGIAARVGTGVLRATGGTKLSAGAAAGSTTGRLGRGIGLRASASAIRRNCRT